MSCIAEEQCGKGEEKPGKVSRCEELVLIVLRVGGGMVMPSRKNGQSSVGLIANHDTKMGKM